MHQHRHCHYNASILDITPPTTTKVEHYQASVRGEQSITPKREQDPMPTPAATLALPTTTMDNPAQGFCVSTYCPRDNELPKQHVPSQISPPPPGSRLLSQYAMFGCPTQIGCPWRQKKMVMAIKQGPHASVLDLDTAAQLQLDVEEKVSKKQAWLINQDNIKQNSPPQLRISPIAMIPYTSHEFRAILDSSFLVKLSSFEVVPMVNHSTTKTAPHGEIN